LKVNIRDKSEYPGIHISIEAVLNLDFFMGFLREKFNEFQLAILSVP